MHTTWCKRTHQSELHENIAKWNIDNSYFYSLIFLLKTLHLYQILSSKQDVRFPHNPVWTYIQPVVLVGCYCCQSYSSLFTRKENCIFEVRFLCTAYTYAWSVTHKWLNWFHECPSFSLEWVCWKEDFCSLQSEAVEFWTDFFWHEFIFNSATHKSWHIHSLILMRTSYAIKPRSI